MSRTLDIRRLCLLFAPLVIGVLAAGCGGASEAVEGTTTPVFEPLPITQAPIELRAVLRGSQEMPPVASLGSGIATAVVSADQSSVQVTIQTSGVGNATAAHIHVAPVGIAGPIIAPLFNAATDGPLPATFSRIVTAADLTPQPGSGVSTFADAVSGILAARTYVNVHTPANPGGEIRGQLGPVFLGATPTGSQEVPPVATAASGSADIHFNGTQTAVRVTLRASNVLNAVASHFHVGPFGQNGPIILPFFSADTDGALPDSLVRTITASNLVPRPEAGILTFDDAVNAILSRGTYINVHTLQNPGGEIRGQVVP